MREGLLSVAKEIEPCFRGDYYHDSFDLMQHYISRKLSAISKKKNATELVNNLDIIIKYTNPTNDNWFYYLCNQPNFIHQVIKNIHHYRYPDNLGTFLYELSGVVTPSELFTEELMDEILKMEIDEGSLSEVVDTFIPETRYVFFKKCLDKNIIPTHMYLSAYSKEIKDLLIQELPKKIGYCTDLFALRRIIGEDEKSLKLVNDYMDNNYDKVHESIMGSFKSNSKYNKDVSRFIYIAIKELVENEQIKYSQIEVDPGGSFSQIVFVGEKVFKFGDKRKTKTFPNNPYIMKPLLRQEMIFGKDTIFMEITEKAEIVSEDLPDEILYDLYKKLRDLGLVWTDIAFRNIGRLKKDNEIHWREDIVPSDETLDLGTYRGKEKLKAGDYVIIDADHIYEEDDPNIEYPDYETYSLFEKKYQREKGNNPSL